MAQAKQAEEPSMEEILASIRRIISDEDASAGDTDDETPVDSSIGSDQDAVEFEATDDMSDAAEMSQDDLDKLFDMDEPDVAEEEVAEEDEAAADDEMAAAMAEAAEEDEGEEDVLELTEEFAVEDEVGADDLDIVGAEDIAFAEEEDPVDEMPDFEPEPAPVAAAPAPQPKPQAPPPSSYDAKPVADDLPDVEADAPLTSDFTGDAVHAAFDNLSNMFVGSQPQTMEELVREMLRPMLKSWLDQNLPGMVEQLVKKEIERVTRRR